ncbi:MAG: caspase family protein [Sphingomonas adhaesiva]|uniref:caspase family protein n=1 Tax=Sphingomonas adhaesiva TaxID=28212 RepID=UPI002FF83125
MTRAAACVGIDAYERVKRLSGCENDASAMHDRLLEHADRSANFASRLHLSSDGRLTRAALRKIVRELFEMRDLEVALFYFAGHGAVTADGSFLVSQEGDFGDEGIAMSEIIAKANGSTARERVIILDCCNAGAVDALFATGLQLPLAKGVSVLASSRDVEPSPEAGGRGVFTKRVCDALDGGAADVLGAVTVASIYAYVDQVFTLFEQRPQFMANVSKLVTIRRAEAAVSPDKLRRLLDYFPEPDHVIQLGPEYEPTAEPNDEAKEAVFADLQRFRGARLVEPHGTEHMYWAAMERRTCGLTPLGRFYWERARARKLD